VEKSAAYRRYNPSSIRGAFIRTYTATEFLACLKGTILAISRITHPRYRERKYHASKATAAAVVAEYRVTIEKRHLQH
jgi:hypothetical protein